MIIWGWRGITRTDGAGNFWCPGCQAERSYKARRTQRFFTLYFIPLIPLESLGSAIQCDTCRKQWVPEVLRHNPALEQQENQRAVSDYYGRLLCHFAIMSGRRDGDFIHQVAELSGGLQNTPINFEEVNKGLDRNNNIGPAVAFLSRYLNDRGREIVVKVATADGTLTDEKREALSKLARELGMTETHLAGVLATWQTPAALAESA